MDFEGIFSLTGMSTNALNKNIVKTGYTTNSSFSIFHDF